MGTKHTHKRSSKAKKPTRKKKSHQHVSSSVDFCPLFCDSWLARRHIQLYMVYLWRRLGNMGLASPENVSERVVRTNVRNRTFHQLMLDHQETGHWTPFLHDFGNQKGRQLHTSFESFKLWSSFDKVLKSLKNRGKEWEEYVFFLLQHEIQIQSCV